MTIRVGSALAVLAVGIVHAQQTGTPPASSFEVASVKVNKSGERAGSFEFAADRVTIRNSNLAGIVMRAYGAYDRQFAPNTSRLFPVLTADRYDIDAKSARPVSRAEMKRMLQSLLEDRFKLAIHRESKEVSGYALVIDKDAAKVREHVGGGGDCVGRRSQDGRLAFQNCAMEFFAGFQLSGMIGGLAADQTGLTGNYDFELLASWELPQNPREGRPDPTVVNPEAPSIFTALKQQLGLRLQPGKITVEFFNIDHVEKPSEN